MVLKFTGNERSLGMRSAHTSGKTERDPEHDVASMPPMHIARARSRRPVSSLSDAAQQIPRAGFWHAIGGLYGYSVGRIGRANDVAPVRRWSAPRPGIHSQDRR